MHQITTGWGWYALVAFYWLELLAAVAIVLDGIVRRRAAGFGSRARQVLWIAPQAVFAVLFVASQVPGLGPRIGLAVLVLVIPVLVAQVAYLLRVVFPKPRPAESDDGDSDGAGGRGADDDGISAA